MEGKNPLSAENIILGLTLYLFPVDFLLKQKRAMRRGTRKPRGSILKRYAACLIEVNEYLDLFPGAKLSEKLA